MRTEPRSEGALMEYSEQAIYELQAILRSKVGDYVPVIKKAMEIEEFLYREALYKTGLDRTGNVWESSEAVHAYMDSIENIKKLIRAKEDFGKIFQIADIRQFYHQLTSLRPPVNKKKDGDSSAPSTTKKEKAKSTKNKPAAPRRSKGASKSATLTIPAPLLPPPPPLPLSFPPVIHEFDVQSISHEDQFLQHNQRSLIPTQMERVQGGGEGEGEGGGHEENLDDQDDLAGFGFELTDDLDSTIETNTMSNAAAWNSMAVATSEIGENEIVESWSEAAEERRNQQKINANMELHRVSQQAELKKARERDAQNSILLQGGQHALDGDLELERERERKLRESEGRELNLTQNYEMMESLDNWE